MTSDTDTDSTGLVDALGLRDVVGTWTFINGTFCYVRSILIENGETFVNLSKSDRDYSLHITAIYEVGA